jgi:hypothetical protein
VQSAVRIGVKEGGRDLVLNDLFERLPVSDELDRSRSEIMTSAASGKEL